MTTINELREKIRQLEKQISERKTLDRGEVEKILMSYIDETYHEAQLYILGSDISEVVDAICSLAIKTLDRDKVDKIVESVFVEKKWIKRLSNSTITGEVEVLEAMDDIVNEICNLAYKPITKDMIEEE